MNRNGKFLLSVVLSASLLLCACGTETQAQSGYRSEFTEEELESGRASFQMDEKLSVDADVTPRFSYENGLSSYYLEVISEPDSEDEGAFAENITFSSHSRDEWEKFLNSLQKGRLKGKEFELDRSIYELKDWKYDGKNGRTYTIWAGWSGWSKKYGLDSRFNTAIANIFPSQGENFEINIMDMMRNCLDDCGGCNDLDFLQDPEEMAEKTRGFLEEASGRKICRKYEFVPAGQKNLERLHELVKKEEPSSLPQIESEMDKRIGEFIFYYDVDGLPFKNLYLKYFLQGDETADSLCYWSSPDSGNLVGISEHAQVADVDEKGLLKIDFSNTRRPGKVYKDKRSVAGPNQILEQIKAYYGRKLMLADVTVTDMELAYTGYFSDGSEGKIQPVVSPVWIVTVYDEELKGISGKKREFVYDAFTGECLREAENPE